MVWGLVGGRCWIPFRPVESAVSVELTGRTVTRDTGRAAPSPWSLPGRQYLSVLPVTVRMMAPSGGG